MPEPDEKSSWKELAVKARERARADELLAAIFGEPSFRAEELHDLSEYFIKRHECGDGLWYGITKRGEVCRRCLSWGRSCHQHEDTDNA